MRERQNEREEGGIQRAKQHMQEGILDIFIVIITFLLDLQFFFFCHNLNHEKQIFLYLLYIYVQNCRLIQNSPYLCYKY